MATKPTKAKSRIVKGHIVGCKAKWNVYEDILAPGDVLHFRCANNCGGYGTLACNDLLALLAGKKRSK